MLTYDFSNANGPLYLFIYNCIKNDIINGVLKANEKLPSKRTFANNNGISTITIQNAYDQLAAEGYIYTLEKKGYYVSNILNKGIKKEKPNISYDICANKDDKSIKYDLSDNGISSDNFPFSVWVKVSRDVMSNQKEELMKPSPTSGIKELRQAISGHLYSFRGMIVDPDQIIIGSGTEQLYEVVVNLLDKDKIYAIENPGYTKLLKIYKQSGVKCGCVSMDENGVKVDELNKVKADVAHICPNHHFPTGITMPASRRYEILAWANKNSNRYIIEDDYDSEFRIEGRPIPTLFSIDACEKVIYMNTFSKSLTPTIRISYMVLPVCLAKKFYEMFSYKSNTVSNFEQYTLAKFISQGYFEKHINRMRLFYARQRKNIIDLINNELGEYCEIIENDSGLHFLIELKIKKEPNVIQDLLLTKGIKVDSINDYYLDNKTDKKNLYIINYSTLNNKKIADVINIIKQSIIY